MCWDPNGEFVASVSDDLVRVWTIGSSDKGECVHELNCTTGNKFSTCVFHPTYPSLLIIGCYEVGVSISVSPFFFFFWIHNFCFTFYRLLNILRFLTLVMSCFALLLFCTANIPCEMHSLCLIYIQFFLFNIPTLITLMTLDNRVH